MIKITTINEWRKHIQSLKKVNESNGGDYWFGVFATLISKTGFEIGPDQFWVIASNENEAKEIFTKVAKLEKSYIKKLIEIIKT